MKKPQAVLDILVPEPLAENMPENTRSTDTKGENTMSISELAVKVKELRELQSLIDEAQAEAEAIKDEIKAHMGAETELRAGEYKITWKSVTASKLDTTALKKAMPDVYSAFARETTTRRFCVA